MARAYGMIWVPNPIALRGRPHLSESRHSMSRLRGPRAEQGAMNACAGGGTLAWRADAYLLSLLNRPPELALASRFRSAFPGRVMVHIAFNSGMRACYLLRSAWALSATRVELASSFSRRRSNIMELSLPFVPLKRSQGSFAQRAQRQEASCEWVWVPLLRR